MPEHKGKLLFEGAIWTKTWTGFLTDLQTTRQEKNNIIGREYFQISQKHLKTVSPALLYTIDGFISTQIVFFSILVFDSVFPVDW